MLLLWLGIELLLLLVVGNAVAQLVDALRYKPEGRFPLLSLEFFIDIILPAALWP
jgi:hypothetical protein